MNNKKVMIGLSGGVDSAVAAYLLKKQGYDVIAGFMRNWDSLLNNDYLGNPTINDEICPQEKDYNDAKLVAEKLNIPILRIDFVKEYWDNVFSYFLSEYEKSRTPNPDVFCNKYIKFDSFLKFAKKNGCDMIAMGHYAKKVNINGVNFLVKAKDLNKDQSYFLCQINQTQLDSAIFPLSDITKNEVREIAHQLNLNVADKKDSTGVCFIGERNFKEFLENYLPSKPGDIVDIETKRVIGKHDGIMYYTIGQRRGLGIGGIKNLESHGWVVCGKNVKKNILYVASKDTDKYLLSNKSLITNLNFIGRNLKDGEKINVKFRYRAKDLPCNVKLIDDNNLLLIHDGYYKAVTPGQIVAFYVGDLCLGGGIIDKVYYNDNQIIYFDD